MLTSMAASFYVVHCELYEEKNLEQSKQEVAQLKKSKTKSNKKHIKQNFSAVFSWLMATRARYILLSFHALLNFFLIFDFKDFFVMCIFIIEGFTIPIHLYLYLKSSPKDSKLKKMYYTFLPVFCSCVLLVIFRYMLFFQK